MCGQIETKQGRARQMKYRAIARNVIYAEQFTSKTEPPPGVFLSKSLACSGNHVVKTIQGQEVPVSVGEWIVKEENGPGYYPIDDAEFQRLYERAPQD